MHKLNSKLDDGNIIFLDNLKIKKKKKIHQLRFINTIKCIEISIKLMKMLINKNKIKSKKQKSLGRYYSFMPSVIKRIIEKKFNDNFK